MDANYMIVDGVVADYVQEISAFIDQINGKTLEDEDSFEKYTTSLMESSDEEVANKVFQAIAEKSVAISKAPEKHFEAMYNLVLFTLTFSSDVDRLLTIVIDNLIANPPEFAHASTAVLFVLTNTFNNLAPKSGFRYKILDAILDYAVQTKSESLLLSQLSDLISWTSEWENVTNDQKSDLLYKASHLFNGWDGLRENYYKYLLKSVELVDVSSNSSSSAEKVTELLQYAISAHDFFDFEAVINLDAVKASSGNKDVAKLLEFINHISTGNYQAVDANYISSAGSAELTKLFQKSADKPKKVALAKLIADYNERAIAYDVIAKGVDVDINKVESIIIDTIKSGLIEGRLSQSTKEFDIHRASAVGSFGLEEWKKVQVKLDMWKDSLKEILVVVQGAGENLKKTA